MLLMWLPSSVARSTHNVVVWSVPVVVGAAYLQEPACISVACTQQHTMDPCWCWHVRTAVLGTSHSLLCLLCCAHVCLLLPSQFVHVLFCLQVYLLCPFVRRYVRSASLTAHILLTAGMVAAALLLLLPLSGVLSLVFVLVILGVSFVCPYWLVHIQKFKAKINGPWDEAVPRIPTSIHSRSSHLS